MNLIPDTIDFESYFAEAQVDSAKIKPASTWADAVVDRFHGEAAAQNWTPTGFEKMAGKFDLRPGELTLWAGVNGHGKTTFLSHIMLKTMQAGQRVCLASMEMKPRDSMAKMTQQAAGVAVPASRYIRGFHSWTNDRLWVYDHLGKLAPSRALAVATYVRNELRIDHLIIDSLMKCGLGTDDYTAQKDFVDSLCAIARDTGLHIHLVVHMRKGENESTPAGKFDVKGAGEIVDLADNLAIVWKNLPKAAELEKANREKDLDKRHALIQQVNEKPDAFVRMAKQRHHSWEGSWAFWFDRASQQFLENPRTQPVFNGLDLSLELEAA